jgi:hypothetical protein
VRPDRLERPTFWFVANNQRIFIDLALGAVVVKCCALLRVFKDFRAVRGQPLAMVHNASLRGVGTKMAHSKWVRVASADLRGGRCKRGSRSFFLCLQKFYLLPQNS